MILRRLGLRRRRMVVPVKKKNKNKKMSNLMVNSVMASFEYLKAISN